MVRHQSDVEIRLYDEHPMAVGSDFRVGRVGWVTDIQWIAVWYQGPFFRILYAAKVQFYAFA
jgi:hypothetical protein